MHLLLPDQKRVLLKVEGSQLDIRALISVDVKGQLRRDTDQSVSEEVDISDGFGGQRTVEKHFVLAFVKPLATKVVTDVKSAETI